MLACVWIFATKAYLKMAASSGLNGKKCSGHTLRHWEKSPDAIDANVQRILCAVGVATDDAADFALPSLPHPDCRPGWLCALLEPDCLHQRPGQCLRAQAIALTALCCVS